LRDIQKGDLFEIDGKIGTFLSPNQRANDTWRVSMHENEEIQRKTLCMRDCHLLSSTEVQTYKNELERKAKRKIDILFESVNTFSPDELITMVNIFIFLCIL
jgi:hypothetical protein